MAVDKNKYSKMTNKASPPTNSLKNCAVAFLVGGAICAVGQGLTALYLSIGLASDEASSWCSVTLIFLSALTTGLGWYEKLAAHAGAGTLVPITGFANAVASPAIEFKNEGFVLGLAAKMFVIAGPVIVYGVTAGIVYGIIIYAFGLF